MNHLILTIGIPGSGKSSWIRSEEHLSLKDCIILCPDKIRKELSGDTSNQSVNTLAWFLVKKRAIEALKDNSVVIDATNVDTVYRREFIKDLPPCDLIAVIFPADPDVCCARIRQDIEAGIDRSNVPEHIIYRMYGDFLYTVKVIESEGFKVTNNHLNLKALSRFSILHSKDGN